MEAAAVVPTGNTNITVSSSRIGATSHKCVGGWGGRLYPGV